MKPFFASALKHRDFQGVTERVMKLKLSEGKVELQGIFFLHDLQNVKKRVSTVEEKSRRVILNAEIFHV